MVIPRGVIYQIDFNDENNRLFIVESKSPIYTPKRYRNWFGQHLESSPSDVGGYKEVVLKITGEEVFRYLKYESGVHRVQRVLRVGREEALLLPPRVPPHKQSTAQELHF